MSFTTWTPPAVSPEAFAWRGWAWRIVESQHIAATMKLVDNRDEQDLLESLLESSKPAQPKETAGLHYLLATPFRYTPKRSGSRFRAATDPGVFYGAQSVQTAGAELGYWRWKFLQDATDLERLDPVAHTAFRVDIDTQAVDLQRPPFDKDAAIWQHPTDYGPTQQFARVARQAQIGGILYRSVRCPQPSWCLALLTPEGFATHRPHPQQQTWYLAVSPDKVTLRGATKSMQFSATDW
ncbi:RES family NAD+ phosphorylase [Castellaniella sp.]|uniref:RES family NAD+ phosphorylase n=1 Tax=Castellaniella sp. TaxID=1955812 RepID=UPI003C7253B0